MPTNYKRPEQLLNIDRYLEQNTGATTGALYGRITWAEYSLLD